MKKISLSLIITFVFIFFTLIGIEREASGQTQPFTNAGKCNPFPSDFKTARYQLSKACGNAVVQIGIKDVRDNNKLKNRSLIFCVEKLAMNPFEKGRENDLKPTYAEIHYGIKNVTQGKNIVPRIDQFEVSNKLGRHTGKAKAFSIHNENQIDFHTLGFGERKLIETVQFSIEKGAIEVGQNYCDVKTMNPTTHGITFTDGKNQPLQLEAKTSYDQSSSASEGSG